MNAGRTKPEQWTVAAPGFEWKKSLTVALCLEVLEVVEDVDDAVLSADAERCRTGCCLFDAEAAAAAAVAGGTGCVAAGGGDPPAADAAVGHGFCPGPPLAAAAADHECCGDPPVEAPAECRRRPRPEAVGSAGSGLPSLVAWERMQQLAPMHAVPPPQARSCDGLCGSAMSGWKRPAAVWSKEHCEPRLQPPDAQSRHALAARDGFVELFWSAGADAELSPPDPLSSSPEESMPCRRRRVLFSSTKRLRRASLWRLRTGLKRVLFSCRDLAWKWRKGHSLVEQVTPSAHLMRCLPRSSSSA
jgi:hypothetical protein